MVVLAAPFPRLSDLLPSRSLANARPPPCAPSATPHSLQDAAVDGLCRFVNAVTAAVLYVAARPCIAGFAPFGRSAPPACPSAGLSRLGLLLSGIGQPSNTSGPPVDTSGPPATQSPEDLASDEAYCRFLWYAGLGLGVLHVLCLTVVVAVLLATPITWWMAARRRAVPAARKRRPAAPVAAARRTSLHGSRAARDFEVAVRLSLG